MRRAASNRSTRHHGFTLVEILVAMGVTGLLMLGIGAFLRQALMTYYSVRAEHIINREVRSITGKLTTDAVTANYFCLYPSFSQITAVVNGVTVDGSLVDGQVGDYLVLVYIDPAQ